MTTLDATLGGTSSNSYVDSTATADTIAATLASLAGLRVSTTGWSAATTAAKTEALALAARAIDGVQYRGEKVDDGQAMQFPRFGTANPLDESVIPDMMKWAQVAEACAILDSTAVDPVARAIDRGVVSETAGGVSFTVGGSRRGSVALNISPPAFDILKRSGLIRSAASSVYGGRT